MRTGRRRRGCLSPHDIDLTVRLRRVSKSVSTRRSRPPEILELRDVAETATNGVRRRMLRNIALFIETPLRVTACIMRGLTNPHCCPRDSWCGRKRCGMTKPGRAESVVNHMRAKFHTSKGTAFAQRNRGSVSEHIIGADYGRAPLIHRSMPMWGRFSTNYVSPEELERNSLSVPS